MISLPGAVPATGPDDGVAWHYGETFHESRALAEGEAFFDLSHLGVVTVSGPDRLSWLHSLLSQDVAGLRPGEGAEAMVLGPKGRIEHVAAVVDDGETTWLITETPDGLVTHLEGMRFMLRVEVEDVTAAWAILGDSVASDSLVDGRLTWVDPWPGVTPGGTSYLQPGTDHPGEGWRRRLTLIPHDEFDPTVASLMGDGLRPVGTWATEASRVAAWRPRALTEVDAVALPHELDWLRTAVHLHKGCFRGQETVAKVHNVGRPPRRLAFLHLDGSGQVPLALPASVVVADGAPGADAAGLDAAIIGRVTSAALHHEDGPIALALLKRGTDPLAPLVVIGSDGEAIAASQSPIVNPAGVSRDRPPPPGPTARGLLKGHRDGVG